MTLSILLAAITGILLVYPLLSNSGRFDDDPRFRSIQHLLDLKERSVQSLRDLELDYGTGKLSEAEYLSLRQQARHELGQLLKQLDAHAR